MHGIEKRIVYILRSMQDPARHYVGLTNDIPNRLEWHNQGPSGYTIDHRPWSLVVAIEFANERDAVRFERYLKSGSGRAFTKRHFAPGTRSKVRINAASPPTRRALPTPDDRSLLTWLQRRGDQFDPDDTSARIKICNHHFASRSGANLSGFHHFLSLHKSDVAGSCGNRELWQWGM